MTRFACTNPSAKPGVGPVRVPARHAARTEVPEARIRSFMARFRPKAAIQGRQLHHPVAALNVTVNCWSVTTNFKAATQGRQIRGWPGGDDRGQLRPRYKGLAEGAGRAVGRGVVTGVSAYQAGICKRPSP